MRQIVYDNIMELIKQNCPIKQQTKWGRKYVLYGKRGNRILSTYRNSYKIQLFVNDELFASTKIPTLFTKVTAHYHQLHNIESALSGNSSHFAGKDIQASKLKFGATPAQVNALQVAWWKSGKMNMEMCSMLGNSR